MSKRTTFGLALAALISSVSCGEVDPAETEVQQGAVRFPGYWQFAEFSTNSLGDPFVYAGPLNTATCKMVTGKLHPSSRFMRAETPIAVFACSLPFNPRWETVGIDAIWYNQPSSVGSEAMCQTRFIYNKTMQVGNMTGFVKSSKNTEASFDEQKGYWWAKGNESLGMRRPADYSLEILCRVTPLADLAYARTYHADLGD